jgi:hypothetical protein
LRTISSADAVRAGHPEGGGIVVDWSAVENPSGGSRVATYRVVVLEGGAIVDELDVTAGTTNTPVLWLSAGHAYQARVTPVNDADTSNWQSTTSATLVAVGPPLPAGGFDARQEGTGGTVALSWNPVDANGSQTMSYFVSRSPLPFGGSSCPADYDAAGNAVPSGTSTTDASDKSDGTYYYALSADNGWSCSVQLTSVTIVQAPGGASFAATRAGVDPVAFIVESPAVDASPGLPVTLWQTLVGSAWVDMTMSLDSTPAVTPTYEISLNAFTDAGGARGVSHNVIIRGCTAAGVCGAQSAPSPLDIP